MKKSISLNIQLDKTLLKRISTQARRKGIFAALNHLGSVSKQQVPLDQGPLRDSFEVVVSSNGTQGNALYDTSYAVRQHENQNYKHQRGRKAKYLEDPVNDSQVRNGMLVLMQKEMSSVIK